MILERSKYVGVLLRRDFDRWKNLDSEDSEDFYYFPYEAHKSDRSGGCGVKFFKK